jgi:hypothetical protein
VGSAAEEAERKKVSKYQQLGSHYHFCPVGVETLGAWGPQAKSLLTAIGNKLVAATGEPRAASYLAQRVSMAIQRGNAASILGTLPNSMPFSEIWDL